MHYLINFRIHFACAVWFFDTFIVLIQNIPSFTITTKCFCCTLFVTTFSMTVLFVSCVLFGAYISWNMKINSSLPQEHYNLVYYELFAKYHSKSRLFEFDLVFRKTGINNISWKLKMKYCRKGLTGKNSSKEKIRPHIQHKEQPETR